jgi:hypothetical protein
MGGDGSGKPKGELLKLNGTEIINGRLEKTKFFDFLQIDLSGYSDIEMTPEQALKFKNTIVRMKHGVSAAMPMLCGGKRCFNKLCVFHDTQKYPLSKQCPLEVIMINSLTKDYMEDLDVDPESISEMTLINKLVECDMIDFRANLGLSGSNSRDEDASTLLSTTVIEHEGGVTETTQLHPLLEAKRKAHKDREKILEAMVGTRREKYKKAAALKQSEGSDASSHFAELKKIVGDAQSTTQTKVTSLDKIKEDAKKVSEDLDVFDADWEE